MNILIPNISKIVTVKSNVTIAIKYEVAFMGFRLVYLDLTVSYFEYQYQLDRKNGVTKFFVCMWRMCVFARAFILAGVLLLSA